MSDNKHFTNQFQPFLVYNHFYVFRLVNVNPTMQYSQLLSFVTIPTDSHKVNNLFNYFYVQIIGNDVFRSLIYIVLV